MPELAWPAGWSRTPGHRRQRGDFHYWGKKTRHDGSESRVKRSITRAMTLSRVQEEVRRHGGTGLRIDTGEELRLDGVPRAQQPRDLDPGVIVSFRLPGNKAIVLPCDHYTSIEQNLAAIAATLEHKRGAERHGVTTREREFAGYAALPSGDPVTDAQAASTWQMPAPARSPYEVLGVAEGAPAEVVRGAYKALLMTNHPDRGGDVDRFREIQNAWDRYQKEHSEVHAT